MTPSPAEPTADDRIRGAFDLARRVAEDPGEYPERFVVMPLEPDTME